MYQVQAYLDQVKSQLSTIDRANAVASYDTGYGMHIVNTHLGDECHVMDVLSHSILKIDTPKGITGDDWYTAWSTAKGMVNSFCKKA